MFDEQLVVIGTGIRTIGQMTLESIAWIKRADKVLYIVSDPIAEDLIKTFNPAGAESLYDLYAENKPRIQTYNEMIEKTLGYVREGKRVCMAAYGHPGVFAYPTHESVRRAQAEGFKARFKARMLPGVSAEDCMFADLNFDPAMAGHRFSDQWPLDRQQQQCRAVADRRPRRHHLQEPAIRHQGHAAPRAEAPPAL